MSTTTRVRYCPACQRDTAHRQTSVHVLTGEQLVEATCSQCGQDNS